MLKILKTLYFFTSFIFLFYNFELLASPKNENNFHAVKEYLKNLNERLSLLKNFIMNQLTNKFY